MGADILQVLVDDDCRMCTVPIDLYSKVHPYTLDFAMEVSKLFGI